MDLMPQGPVHLIIGVVSLNAIRTTSYIVKDVVWATAANSPSEEQDGPDTATN